MKAPYRCIYDGDTFIDGFDCQSLGEAKNAAKDILIDWMSYCPTDTDEWDYMIYNCMTWVEEYNEETGEYEEIWYPEDSFLESIGWIERGE